MILAATAAAALAAISVGTVARGGVPPGSHLIFSSSFRGSNKTHTHRLGYIANQWDVAWRERDSNWHNGGCRITWTAMRTDLTWGIKGSSPSGMHTGHGSQTYDHHGRMVLIWKGVHSDCRYRISVIEADNSAATA